jgi:hypothetical protein
VAPGLYYVAAGLQTRLVAEPVAGLQTCVAVLVAASLQTRGITEDVAAVLGTGLTDHGAGLQTCVVA